tara:strand:+ start:875 stop:1048 length:174 start_codon:yes stop_codon:yes gene_type:complete
MKTFHVECYETVHFTVEVEAETLNESIDLARANINSFEVVSEATSEWEILDVKEVLQ